MGWEVYYGEDGGIQFTIDIRNFELGGMRTFLLTTIFGQIKAKFQLESCER